MVRQQKVRQQDTKQKQVDLENKCKKTTETFQKQKPNYKKATRERRYHYKGCCGGHTEIKVKKIKQK